MADWAHHVQAMAVDAKDLASRASLACVSEDMKERAWAARMACAAAAAHLARFRGGVAERDEPHLEALLRAAARACQPLEPPRPRVPNARGDGFEVDPPAAKAHVHGRTSLAVHGIRAFALFLHHHEDVHLRAACRSFWKVACAGCPWAAHASMEGPGDTWDESNDALERMESLHADAETFAWTFDLQPEDGAIPIDTELMRPMCDVLGHCAKYASEETKAEAAKALYALDARATAELCPEMMLLAGSLARQL